MGDVGWQPQRRPAIGSARFAPARRYHAFDGDSHRQHPGGEPPGRRRPDAPSMVTMGLEQAREAGLFRHRWSDAREQPAQQTDALTRRKVLVYKKTPPCFLPVIRF